MEGLYCPQCGEETERLTEGYCEDCAKENHEALLRHNYEYDEWNKLSDSERRARINQS